MSKEQTPLDALNILRALVESNEEHHDYRISTEAVKLCLDEIEEAITKEAQQREELVKAVAVESHFKGSEMVCRNTNIPLSEEDEKALHLDAEDHYNEVIKQKYLNK